MTTFQVNDYVKRKPGRQRKPPNQMRAVGNTVEIIVESPTFGRVVGVVDETDASLVSQHRWHTDKHGYLRTHVNGRVVLIHQLIVGHVPAGMEIDHFDGNPRNNLRSNLRIATPRTNAENRVRAKGYSFEPVSGKYRAEIRVRGHLIVLGRFTTEIDAHNEYRKAKAVFHNDSFIGSTEPIAIDIYNDKTKTTETQQFCAVDIYIDNDDTEEVVP